MRERYLLIISCSQLKRTQITLLPAIERYNGGNYKILRKAQREKYLSQYLNIAILSAKYGLINSTKYIECYEQRMTQMQAEQLQEKTSQILQDYASANEYQEIYIDLGKEYLSAIGDIQSIFATSQITLAKGRIGQRQAALKQWILSKRQQM